MSGRADVATRPAVRRVEAAPVEDVVPAVAGQDGARRSCVVREEAGGLELVALCLPISRMWSAPDHAATRAFRMLRTCTRTTPPGMMPKASPEVDHVVDVGVVEQPVGSRAAVDPAAGDRAVERRAQDQLVGAGAGIDM